ncbi:MAG TPA: ADOP family duplicated permease [Thermoanaerobaculia bacterium]|nr:ADOP family duplicated permease [Thermoanaerobaculia bacterium]
MSSRPSDPEVIDWRSVVRSGLAGIGRRASSEQLEELESLLDAAYQAELDGGACPAEARRRALRTLGSWEELGRRLLPAHPPRADRGGNGSVHGRLGGLLHELRFAVRGLRRQRALSLVSILVLALGIGVTTAVYSVIHAILLAPLPLAESERLGLVRIDALGQRGLPRISSSNVVDFAGASTLAALELFDPGKEALEIEGAMTLENAIWVSPGLPDLIGAPVIHGRAFLPEDAEPRNVLISHHLFERRFEGDPSSVGATVTVGDRPARVVGVLAPGFRFHSERGRSERRDLWIASPRPVERGTVFTRQALVRLAPGISFAEASLELDAIAERSLELDGARDDEAATYEVVPLAEHLAEPYRRSLVALLVAGACVLGLVCANVAGLLVVRSLSRREEWALRSALGARRGRIVWAGLAEGLVLSVAGGALAVAIAMAVVRTLRGAEEIALPRLETAQIDGPVLLFALAATTLAGLLAGVLPALVSLRSSLAVSHRTVGSGGRPARWLAVAQIAIALTLLAGAGALLRTVVNLQRVELGFDPEGLVTFDFSTPRELWQDHAARLRLVREVSERLVALPEVRSAGVTNLVPLEGGLNLASWSWDEETERSFGELTGSFHRVLPGYFETLGAPLLAGRDFSRSDTENGAHVTIVSDTLARRAWGVERAVGQSLQVEFATGDGGTERRSVEVIGVVAEMREVDLHSEQLPQAWLPYWPHSVALDFVVRLEEPGVDLRAAISSVLAELGPGMVLDDYRPLEESVRRATAERRVALALVGVFAVIALVVAALGLYGALAHRVRQQRGEIGLRIALGASRGSVARGVVRQALAIVGSGLLLGGAAAFGLLRVYRSQLYEVEPGDPTTYLAVIALLLAVGCAAAALPAARATRVEPSEALRAE